MIHVIASIQVKPECLYDFIEHFKANIPNVLSEQGCIEYTPAIDTDSGLEVQMYKANTVTVIEKWETLKDLHEHLAAPHMEQFRDATAVMVEEVSLVILENA